MILSGIGDVGTAVKEGMRLLRQIAIDVQRIRQELERR